MTIQGNSLFSDPRVYFLRTLLSYVEAKEDRFADEKSNFSSSFPESLLSPVMSVYLIGTNVRYRIFRLSSSVHSLQRRVVLALWLK